MTDTKTPAPDGPPERRRPKHQHVLIDSKSNKTFLPFVITRHREGEIISAVSRPKLQMSEGHLAALPLGDFDKALKQKLPVWVTTADGFRKANTVAGWQVTFPPNITIPDPRGGSMTVGNPHIQTDASGGFVSGWARAIGIGRSALTGDLLIIDRPVHLSVQSYIEEDLAGKAQWNPTSIVWGSAGMNPMDAVRAAVEKRNAETNEKIAEYLSKKKPWSTKNLEKGLITEEHIDQAELEYGAGLWQFIPILGDHIGLWINVASSVVQRVFQTLVNKRKFGSRLLYAVAERNVLRSALGFYRAPEGAVKEVWSRVAEGSNDKPKLLDGEWSPMVHTWRMDVDEREIARLRDQYMIGIRGGLLRDVEIDAELQDVSTESDLLLTSEQGGGGPDGEEVSPHTLTLPASLEEEGKAEMEEREQLLIEVTRLKKMVPIEVDYKITHALFGCEDPFFDSYEVETLRQYVAQLKKAAQEHATEPQEEGGQGEIDEGTEAPPKEE